MTRERLEQIYNKERGIPQAHEIADLVCEIERCWSELARYKALVDRLAKVPDPEFDFSPWSHADIREVTALIAEARALKETPDAQ